LSLSHDFTTLKVKFEEDYDMKWAMLCIGIAFVFMFRFQHYMFVYQSTSKLGASLEAKKGKKGKHATVTKYVPPAIIHNSSKISFV
jgi:hypothetical protein